MLLGYSEFAFFYCFYIERNTKNVALYYTADHLDSRMSGLQSAFSQVNPLHESLPLAKILKDVYVKCQKALTCTEVFVAEIQNFDIVVLIQILNMDCLRIVFLTSLSKAVGKKKIQSKDKRR